MMGEDFEAFLPQLSADSLQQVQILKHAPGENYSIELVFIPQIRRDLRDQINDAEMKFGRYFRRRTSVKTSKPSCRSFRQTRFNRYRF